MTVKRYTRHLAKAEEFIDGHWHVIDYVKAADHDAAITAKDTMLDALNNELNAYVKHLGAKDAEIAALRYVIDERMVEHHDYSVSLLERITALEAENAALREREPDAYLVEIVTPEGGSRREVYHTEAGAASCAAIYARSKDKWVTRIYPLTRLRECGDADAALKAAAGETGEHHGN